MIINIPFYSFISIQEYNDILFISAFRIVKDIKKIDIDLNRDFKTLRNY